MYCRECGKQLRDDSKFCAHCGTKVEPETVNESNVTQPKKAHQKTWYEEINATTNDEIKHYANEGSKGNNFLIMTISLIWLAISGFMPIIEVVLWDEGCSFFDISDIIEILSDFDFSDNLLSAITFMCKAAYIIGIILVIAYFVNLVKLCRDDEKVCNFSKYATILLSVPTVVILIEKLIIDSKVNDVFGGGKLLSFTPLGWITIIVMIINIIVSCNSKETHYRAKYIMNNAIHEEKVCMLCKTRYNGGSCPVCGSSLIVK